MIGGARSCCRQELQAGDAAGLGRQLLQGKAVKLSSNAAAGLQSSLVSAAGLGCVSSVSVSGGMQVPQSSWAHRAGLGENVGLHLPLLCDFIMLRLPSTQTAVGKLSTQILQAVLPQNLYFPCGSAGRDRCLAGRFSFMLLDQTKASNLQEFKCSNRNILALPSLNTCIINISWKNWIIKVLFL